MKGVSNKEYLGTFLEYNLRNRRYKTYAFYDQLSKSTRQKTQSGNELWFRLVISLTGFRLVKKFELLLDRQKKRKLYMQYQKPSAFETIRYQSHF